MKVNKSTDVFNLMDTNGRREDIINAYEIYLKILQKIKTSADTNWAHFPKSLNQYKFYKLAIEKSKNTFEKHPKFDEFESTLKKHSDVKMAFNNKDEDKLSELLKEYTNLKIKDLDKYIESRARHYTNNLVKIGFTDSKRNISSVGMSYLNNSELSRDKFENLLPIKDGNLIFLRQLMKLKIFTKDYTKSYNPMLMAFNILLNEDKIDKEEFLKLVVMINPCFQITPDEILKNIKDKNSVMKKVEDYNTRLIKKSISSRQSKEFKEIGFSKKKKDLKNFKKFIKSGKKKSDTEIFLKFYLSLIEYKQTKKIDNLYRLYKEHKGVIDNAFTLDNHLFKFDKKKDDCKKFESNNKNNKIFNELELNSDFFTNFYIIYKTTTRINNIKEYSDTFCRLLNASGVVSFENGLVELKYKDLWKELFNEIKLDSLVYEKNEEKKAKKFKLNEGTLNSAFSDNIPISEILGVSNLDTVLKSINKKFKTDPTKEVKETLLNQTDVEFKNFIKKNFSLNTVIEILSLFEDRNNDDKIKNLVDCDASIPTIYEYMVGIAWFYISEDKYNLFESFNLSMDANFKPVIHAGGGEGDIIIDYPNETLMIEATLMNAQAQKRGEWEPVLRHATNLTIDKENKKVKTLFVATELDSNSINIWRNVATVPLESSKKEKNSNKKRLANNVTIMPIKNNELLSFLQKRISSRLLIKEIGESFEKLPRNFDESWRDKIINNFLD